MARASWSGDFRIGSLVMPVKLYSATTSLGPRFIQLHKKDLAPINRIAVCSKDHEDLEPGDITRGIEHNGAFIEITDKDLENVGVYAKDIIVRQFTDKGAVSSIYYDKPYYVIPDSGGELTYTVFRNALKNTDKTVIATYCMYGKQRIGIITTLDGTLVLQQLKYPAEIVDVRDIRTPALPQPSPDQVQLAERLIARYSTDFYIDDYRNEQQDLLEEIVERKAKGITAKRQKKLSAGSQSETDIASTLEAMLKSEDKSLASAA